MEDTRLLGQRNQQLVAYSKSSDQSVLCLRPSLPLGRNSWLCCESHAEFRPLRSMTQETCLYFALPFSLSLPSPSLSSSLPPNSTLRSCKLLLSGTGCIFPSCLAPFHHLSTPPSSPRMLIQKPQDTQEAPSAANQVFKCFGL